MRHLTATDKIVITKDQVSCEMGKDVVILNVVAGEYFELNYVGARIWEMIQKPCRRAEIEAALLERFEVQPEVLRADVAEVIQSMIDKGLARIEE